MRGLIGFLVGICLTAGAMAADDEMNRALQDAKTFWDVVTAVEGGATNLDAVYRHRIASGWDNPENQRIIDYLVQSGATIKSADLNQIYAGMLTTLCGGGKIPDEKWAFFADPELKYDASRGVRYMLDTMTFVERFNAEKVLCLLNVASQHGGGVAEITYAYEKAARYDNVLVMEMPRAILNEIEQMQVKQ